MILLFLILLIFVLGGWFIGKCVGELLTGETKTKDVYITNNYYEYKNLTINNDSKEDVLE